MMSNSRTISAKRKRKENFLKKCGVLHQEILLLEQMYLDVFLINII